MSGKLLKPRVDLRDDEALDVGNFTLDNRCDEEVDLMDEVGAFDRVEAFCTVVPLVFEGDSDVVDEGCLLVVDGLSLFLSF
jgi:hypothetical protein